jgi:hypothetical protein
MELCCKGLIIGLILSSLAMPSPPQDFVLTHKTHTLCVKGLIPIREASLLMNQVLDAHLIDMGLLAHTYASPTPSKERCPGL